VPQNKYFAITLCSSVPQSRHVGLFENRSTKTHVLLRPKWATHATMKSVLASSKAQGLGHMDRSLEDILPISTSLESTLFKKNKLQHLAPAISIKNILRTPRMNERTRSVYILLPLSLFSTIHTTALCSLKSEYKKAHGDLFSKSEYVVYT